MSVEAIESLADQRRFSRRRKFRLRSALSSMKRLFDAPCGCDMAAAEAAISEWKDRMAEHRPIENILGFHDPLWLLRKHVRELTEGWGTLLAEAREGSLEGGENLYFPDQQGCLERSRGNGGTLAVPYEAESLDGSLLRLGAAKTKGKLRVVSMQSARVKRVLSPIHNALYTWLTRSGWCVRGEVQKEDFQRVVEDRRAGEKFISGDYEAATDNISQDAVRAIVDVLCEDKSLTEEERCVLYESFRNLRWYNPCTGSSGPILRGSMMGNLVSFPILCLLNKSCFDISCDISYGPGKGRVGRFNGDDCCFNGNSQFYQLWVNVTTTFGLVVNRKKTAIDSRFIELNSRVYDTSNRRFVDKPVLSFFRRKEDSVECLISDILKGLSGFRRGLIELTIFCTMRYECSIRRPAVANIPKGWLKTLLRKKWFRESLTRDPPPVLEKGTDRSEVTVLGPPPRERFYSFVTRACLDTEADRLKKWKGVRVVPASRRIARPEIKKYLKQKGPPSYVFVGKPFWSFLWPRGLWELVSVSFPSILLTRRERSSKWLTDHPRLHVETPVSSLPVFSYKSELASQFRPVIPSTAVLCKDVNFMSSCTTTPSFYRL